MQEVVPAGGRADQTKTHRFHPGRRQKLFGLLAVAVVAAAAAAGLWLTRQHSAVPASIRQNVSFPLYYPSNLPAGWKIIEGSWSAAAGVVTFAVKDAAGNSYAVSEQPFPAGINVSDFEKQKMTNPTTIVTSFGQGIIGRLENIETASFSTKVWILIRASGNNQSQAKQSLSTIVNGLIPVKN